MIRIVDVVSESDRVAVRLTLTGTHEDELMGVPASHRSMSFGIMAIVHFDNWGADRRTLERRRLSHNAPADRRDPRPRSGIGLSERPASATRARRLPLLAQVGATSRVRGLPRNQQ